MTNTMYCGADIEIFFDNEHNEIHLVILFLVLVASFSVPPPAIPEVGDHTHGETLRFPIYRQSDYPGVFLQTKMLMYSSVAEIETQPILVQVSQLKL